MNNHSTDILFHIETETQFEAIRPLLTYLKSNSKTTFDIVVPSATADDNVDNKGIYDGAAQVLLKNGFDVIRGINSTVMPDPIVNTEYKIMLSAYMYQWHYDNLRVKYRIMFPYASYYFNKPRWTVERFINLDYLADALLAHSVGTKPVTDIFTKTYVVPALKLMDFRKRIKPNKKPVIFFAPTYDEIDFAANFLNSVDDIKEKYLLTMRGHHRVSRLKNNEGVYEKLIQAADNIYDPEEYSLVTPLEEADIVVSDNSGVIFDAISCGVPVVLFSQDPNSFHYRDINTAQSELVNNGDVLWTNDPSNVLRIIDETLTTRMLKKQQKLRRKLFPDESTDPVEQWMEILSTYLNDQLPYEYSLTKRYWIEHISRQTQPNQLLQSEVASLTSQLEYLDAKIQSEIDPGVRTAGRRLIRACLYKLHIMKRDS